MDYEKLQQEGGFTLVELLIVTATLSILIMLSVHSYSIYRGSAFDASAENSIHNVKSALQAGLIENDFMAGIGFAWADLTSAGAPSTPMGRNLLPGYMHPGSMNLSVWYDAWCANGLLGNMCMVSGISGRHCSGNTEYLHQSFHNGADIKLEWQVVGAC